MELLNINYNEDINSDNASHYGATRMDASSIIEQLGHKRNFKSKEQRRLEFTPAKISEKYNLSGIINFVLETTQSGIPTMEPSTQETTSNNNVDDLPLKEKQNPRFWGFTPSAETLNGRLAMIGFVAALLLELFSGQGILHLLNLL